MRSDRKRPKRESKRATLARSERRIFPGSERAGRKAAALRVTELHQLAAVAVAVAAAQSLGAEIWYRLLCTTESVDACAELQVEEQIRRVTHARAV
ncbi:hypothetical protein FGB62_1g321 [Gracilaria domingensis]|nr:hypothetical protein FGB62_1g321 [Gracilaria domingensis]